MSRIPLSMLASWSPIAAPLRFSGGRIRRLHIACRVSNSAVTVPTFQSDTHFRYSYQIHFRYSQGCIFSRTIFQDLRGKRKIEHKQTGKIFLTFYPEIHLFSPWKSPPPLEAKIVSSYATVFCYHAKMFHDRDFTFFF